MLKDMLAFENEKRKDFKDLLKTYFDISIENLTNKHSSN